MVLPLVLRVVVGVGGVEEEAVVEAVVEEVGLLVGAITTVTSTSTLPPHRPPPSTAHTPTVNTLYCLAPE